MLVTDPLNLRYLSGFSGSAGALILAPGLARMVTDGRYAEQSRAQAPDLDIVISTDPAWKVAAAELRERAFAAIACEMTNLTWAQSRELAEILGESPLRPEMGLVESLRSIKDAGEIAMIRRAARVADEVFADLLEWLGPGVVEREAAARMNYEMQRRGASGPSFETIVASGPRGSLPHGVAAERVLAEGDLVVLDFGAFVDGYASDMTRTVCVGEPGEEARRVYDAVLASHDAALAAIRPGVACREIDRAARDLLLARGLAERFTHSLGHGVGLAVHEAPRLSLKSEDVLRAGMVVTVEPGVYLPGWGGVRIEDLVWVTDNGPEVLSRSPRELIAVGTAPAGRGRASAPRKDA